MIRLIRGLALLAMATLVVEAALFGAHHEGAWWLIALPVLMAFLTWLFSVFSADPHQWVARQVREIDIYVFSSTLRGATAALLLAGASVAGGLHIHTIWGKTDLTLVVFDRRAAPDQRIAGATIYGMHVIANELFDPVTTDANGTAIFKPDHPSTVSFWIETERRGSRQRAYLYTFDIDRKSPTKTVILASLPNDAWEPVAVTSRPIVARRELPIRDIVVGQVIGQNQRTQGYAPWGLPEAEIPILREHLAIGYSPDLKIPRWTAYKITPGDGYDRQAIRLADQDPAFDAALQANTSDYRRSGFDRGTLITLRHLSGLGTDVIQQAAYTTGIAPQSPNLNRRVWVKLEIAAEKIADDGADVYVLSGPAFLGRDGQATATLTTIGENAVAVPSHFFRIIVRNSPEGLAAWSFLMPNDIDRDAVPATFQVPVATIAQVTGLDFFPSADNALREALQQANRMSMPGLDR